MKAALRQPGSVILREFRAAMEHARATGQHAKFRGGTRNFAAADSSRLTSGWMISDASINAQLRAALPMLRMRSRSWSKNTGPGRRFLSLVRNGMIGPTGLNIRFRCGDWVKQGSDWTWKLDKLANIAMEQAFGEWCLAGNCELSGRLSYADVCKLQVEHLARDGEHLARHILAADNKWGYALQLLVPERIDHSLSVTPPNGNEIIMGVERNEAGRALFHHLLRFNPGDARGTRDAERVPSSQVLHDFVPLEAEQARGVPWSHAILLGSHNLASFFESAIYAARVGAAHMGFYLQENGPDQGPVKVEDVAGAEADDDGEVVTEAEPGMFQLLPKGIKDFKAFDAKYPSEAFGPFVKSHKHDQAAGLDVAHHNLSGDLEGVNYSSARIGEMGERDNWRGLTHGFSGRSVRPVIAKWLEMSLLKGAIVLPGGLGRLPVSKLEKYLSGLVIQGRGWEWTDPKNEALANEIAIKQQLKTRTQIVASMTGGSYEDNVIEQAQEAEIRKAHGVELEASQAAAAPAAADDDTEPADKTSAADKPKKEGKA